jgi:glyoxylase-like metal-dependent hydrolase (beta-lactamase superfamily II)
LFVLTPKLEAAQARTRERWYPHFAWVLNQTTPWTSRRVPVSDATVALVSTCGLYAADTQLPFDAWNDAGDPSFREIHLDTPVDRLRISHSHYDHSQVAADIGVALPFAHFQKLVEQKIVGGLHPWSYHFMGYLPEPFQLIQKTAPRVAQRLVSSGVDAVFLTPC